MNIDINLSITCDDHQMGCMIIKLLSDKSSFSICFILLNLRISFIVTIENTQSYRFENIFWFLYKFPFYRLFWHFPKHGIFFSCEYSCFFLEKYHSCHPHIKNLHWPAWLLCVVNQISFFLLTQECCNLFCFFFH